jgi:hypothetical protein
MTNDKDKDKEYEAMLRTIRYNRQMQKKRLYEQAKRARKNQSEEK